MRNAIRSVRATPASVAAPSIAAAPTACRPERPPAIIRLDTVTPSGSLWRKMAMNTIRPRAARRVTASAPTTLPSAATKAYQKALDTGEEVVAGVTGRILEHFREQPLERLPHLRPGAHPGGQEIVPLHRQVLHRQRILRCSNGRDDFRQPGNGKRETGNGESRQQGQQVVRVLPHLR